ncbi:MAG TPA: response regulator [Candidatus Bathyarchaeia archaeon]|nr:response regulator [Candidatus Bathyarchaeia archaeon]
MRNILMIDDEERVARQYKKFLEQKGYRVILAKSAQEGTREMIREQKIDLILLDINMNEVDGCYMRDVIREYDDRLRVMVFSVYPLDEQRRMIPNAEAYFDKADSVDVFLEKVSKLLDDEGPSG